MTGHTATVEVLTAEVRVLMVGSRQITLSVFAQLDEVKPHAIRAFGRVRPRDVGQKVLVVGADDEGNLCRAWIYSNGFTFGYSGCKSDLRISENPEIYNDLSPISASWETLPLIVLAGLR